jgi:hypothetical protein
MLRTCFNHVPNEEDVLAAYDTVKHAASKELDRLRVYRDETAVSLSIAGEISVQYLLGLDSKDNQIFVHSIPVRARIPR